MDEKDQVLADSRQIVHMKPVFDAAMLVVKHSAVTGEAAGRHGLYVHVTIDADAWRALKIAAEEVERG